MIRVVLDLENEAVIVTTQEAAGQFLQGVAESKGINYVTDIEFVRFQAAKWSMQKGMAHLLRHPRNRNKPTPGIKL